MMRVDYYLFDQATPEMLVQYTCRLLNKAYQAGLRTYVLAESSEQAMVIDRQLWLASDTSFVPHAITNRTQATHPLNKICIGPALENADDFDFLVNLKPEEKIQDNLFSRVAELVPSEDAHKIAARKRYALWREAGAELNTHNIQHH